MCESPSFFFVKAHRGRADAWLYVGRRRIVHGDLEGNLSYPSPRVLGMGLGVDFRRLWRAFGVSEFGSAVGSGALPLIAIFALDASDLQVSLLAALSGVAAAMIALPLGPWIEFRPKRPVMIGA